MLISETEGSLRINDDRRLSIIDVSSADDSLIANYHSENVEWLQTLNLNVLDPDQEDVHKSCKSISTLESYGSSQESPEAGARASIQKSGKKSNVVSASANSKVSSGFQSGGSSKKVADSCNKATSSKSPSTSRQGTGKVTKKNTVSPQLPQKKPVARRAEPSISKQLKAIGKSNLSSTISSQRASLGDSHVKSGKDSAKRIMGGKVNSMTNTNVTKGSRVIASKPTMSSKSPSDLSVATKTKSTISSSSASNLSGNIGKSPLNSLKRKVDAGVKPPLSSCSVVRTPSKVSSRDKIKSSNSSLSSISSVTKLSSSVLPASSISNTSSESLTSIAKYRSNSSRTSFNSSSRKKDLSDIDARRGLNSQNCRSDSSLERKETRHTGFTSHRVRIVASEMVLPRASKKASGLPTPSSKMGLCDGVKFSVPTPHEGMQPHSVVSPSLPKHGTGSVSRSKGLNKAKLGKLQPERSTISIENQKFNNQQTRNPIPLHESSNVVTNKYITLLPHSLPKHGRGDVSLHKEEKNKANLGKLQAERSITLVENKKLN